jgi:3-hydroxyisobutyrate dehydrogenase-like beta-hydroxyacid dehydrogenase
MPDTIAIIAQGEMGAAVGGRLRQGGARVLTSLQGRSDASRRRAEQHGLIAVDGDDALVAEADFFLSILPPDEAPALAERLRAPLTRAKRKPIYIDCNAVAVETAKEIADILAPTGCRVLDAGIIGGPPRGTSAGPKFYVSGPGAKDAERLGAYGLRIRLIDGPVGAASALKMAYAGFTKGLTGLGATMILGAERGGCAEALRRELAESQPELLAWLGGYLGGMPPKAYRWVGEMQEISGFLRQDPSGHAMFDALARLYERLAADFTAAKPDGEVARLKDFMSKAAEAQASVDPSAVRRRA